MQLRTFTNLKHYKQILQKVQDGMQANLSIKNKISFVHNIQ